MGERQTGCGKVERLAGGCPSGQRERSVKSPAKPTQVRILLLPPTGSNQLGRSRSTTNAAGPRIHGAVNARRTRGAVLVSDGGYGQSKPSLAAVRALAM